MNAIEMLKEDHVRVRAVLEELAATTNRSTAARPELLKKLAKEVTIHTKLEEELFYPAFRKATANKEDKLYFEALEEHVAVGDLLIPHLAATDPATDKFAGRVKVLKHMLERHMGEEEAVMFPKAQANMEDQTLNSLGQKMEARKKELISKQDSWMGSWVQTMQDSTNGVVGMIHASKHEHLEDAPSAYPYFMQPF